MADHGLPTPDVPRSERNRREKRQMDGRGNKAETNEGEEMAPILRSKGAIYFSIPSVTMAGI
jgi:hypothetical protein